KLRSRQIKDSSGLHRNFEETTFAEEAKFWLEFQATKFSPGHCKRVRAIIGELVPVHGRFNPNYFTALRLEQIQGQLLDKGAKAATVNRKTEVINAILNFSAKHKRIPFNPASGYSKLKEVREEMKFWDEG